MVGNTGTYLDSPYHRYPDTGGDIDWGTADYARRAPHLTGAGARWLVEHDARLVGIDAVNIDDTEPVDGIAPGARPAHTLPLAAEIPVVEHLTGLDRLPPHSARFTAAAPRIAGFGTFPVRAYAAVPDPRR